MYSRLIFLVLFLFSFSGHAKTLFGTGFNSAIGGRLSPALNLGVGWGSFETQFTSTGVSTTSYYHSSYNLDFYKSWLAGEMFAGRVEAGFGGGVLYAVRGYTSSATSKDTKSDYVVGPSFFVRLIMIEYFYISVNGLYGLIGPSSKNSDLMTLNARDNVSFAVGFIW